MKDTTKRRRFGRSVQDLIGIKTFTGYGLLTTYGELLFYQVNSQPFPVKTPVSPLWFHLHMY